MADNRVADVNGGADDDEALRTAIALSLGENPDDHIDLTQDDTDNKATVDAENHGSIGSPGLRTPQPSTSAPAPSSILGLNRVQMEEERLARLEKRKRPDYGTDQSSPESSPQKRHRASNTTTAISPPPGCGWAFPQANSVPSRTTEASSSISAPSIPEGGSSTASSQQSPAPRTAETSSAVSAPFIPDRSPTPGPSQLGPSQPGPSQPGPSQPGPSQPGPIPNGAPGTGPPQQNPAPNPTADMPAAIQPPVPADVSPLPFPKGVVKKTWVNGFPRRGDDIMFEEVLQAEILKTALLSSFQWDYVWLFRKIFDLDGNRPIPRVTLAVYAADVAHQQEILASAHGVPVRFMFPPNYGGGIMHSKLMLLSFGTYLRIAVPTGNLVSYDWGETGTLENMVFIIDLPLIEDIEQRRAQKFTRFYEDLTYFLKHQHMDERLLNSLRSFDFSETRKYAFVHTISGFHHMNGWKLTGYGGLGRAVSHLGLHSDGPIELDYLTGSVGRLNYDFIRAIYYACQGDDGLRECDLRLPSGNSRRPFRPDSDMQSILDHMRVYFPSQDTVMKSRGGAANGGTLCLAAEYWESSSFPREIFRDSKNVRNGVLLHTKVIFVRRHGYPRGSASGFAYVGSANLSESAWGRIYRAKNHGNPNKNPRVWDGNPKMQCRNWECGVLVPAALIPLYTGASNAVRDGPRPEDLAMFSGWVPIPMQLPAKRLIEDAALPEGSRRPWFFNVEYR